MENVKHKVMLILIFVGIIAGAVSVDRFLSSKRPQKVSFSDQASSLDPESWQDAPAVVLTTLGQSTVSLQDYKGKVVLLNFWATWCPSCKVEFASLLKLVRTFDGQMVLVAVSVDQDKKAIENFLESLQGEFAQELNGKNVVISWDPERQITSDIFQTERFPEAIIISKDMRMARKIIGAYDWESSEMREFMKRLSDL